MIEAASTARLEIAKFDALAENWWRPDGPMAMLHQMHPCRMGFIRTQIDANFAGDFTGKKALDVGCGGGITAESLARLGFDVHALDGSAQLIAAAKAHGAAMELPIRYHHSMLDEFSEKHTDKFDLICAMEVIEHVDDPAAFLRDCASLLQPNGLLILSTLNRTAKSRLMAIGLAEYAFRLLPVGTHDWHKFVKPSEIADALPEFHLCDIKGMVPELNMKQWHLRDRLVAVNYVMALRKGEAVF